MGREKMSSESDKGSSRKGRDDCSRRSTVNEKEGIDVNESTRSVSRKRGNEDVSHVAEECGNEPKRSKYDTSAKKPVRVSMDEKYPEDTTVYAYQMAPEVTEKDVDKLFSTAGKVISIRLIRGHNSKRMLAAYIAFVDVKSASNAIGFSNKMLRGAPVLVKHADVTNKLCLGNLDSDLTEHQVKEVFKTFGTVELVDLRKNSQGQCLGFGFVRFTNHVDAALPLRGQLLINDKVIEICAASDVRDVVDDVVPYDFKGIDMRSAKRTFSCSYPYLAYEYKECFFIKECMEDPSIYYRIGLTIERWHPPKKGVASASVDASGGQGYGFIIRDHMGKELLVAYGKANDDFVKSSEYMEAYGVLRLLRNVDPDKRPEFSRLKVTCDHQYIMNLLTNRKSHRKTIGSPELNILIGKIDHLIREKYDSCHRGDRSIEFIWTRRERNFAADRLTHMGNMVAPYTESVELHTYDWTVRRCCEMDVHTGFYFDAAAKKKKNKQKRWLKLGGCLSCGKRGHLEKDCLTPYNFEAGLRPPPPTAACLVSIQAVVDRFGTPSECLLLKNMFDPSNETERDLMKLRFELKCPYFGPVDHWYLEECSGLVYVRFKAVGDAVRCLCFMSSREFYGKFIVVSFLEYGDYKAAISGRSTSLL